MSYIEKEKIIKADIASIENKVRHAFNQGYDLGYKDGKSNLVLSNISLDAYKQVARERDIAIEQLHELGYEFGQKIEPNGELEEIKSIVNEWNNNTWADYCSYDCMIKIAAIINKTESENK